MHELGVQRVAVLGLSFKAGTDYLRESPVITLSRDLWQDGIDILVHDPDVDPGSDVWAAIGSTCNASCLKSTRSFALI